MGEPILKASDVPTRLPANKGQSAVKSELDVDGLIWNVTCVSMGNPHCVTFGTKGCQVCIPNQTFYYIESVIKCLTLIDSSRISVLLFFLSI